jgi:CubicO group peptidase (beta-lactamase class C family)
MIIQQKKSAIMTVKKYTTCLKGTLLLSCMLLLQFAFAQKPIVSPYDFTALTKKLEASKNELGKMYAVQITKDGKPIYRKENTDFDTKAATNIGVASQWLTATLIMQLVDAGKISLDDKVGSYLPIFNQYFKKYITIRHCLQHNTGIKSEETVLKMFEKNRFATLEEEVNMYASKRDIETNPGEAVKYNGIGFAIAARIVEVVGKRTFAQQMSDKILRPLNMRFSTFTDENDRVNASSGCYTSAVDMSNFLTMLLNNGIFNGKQIVSADAIEQMETLSINPTTIQIMPTAVKSFDYGLGCFIAEKNNSGKASTVAAFSLYGSFMYIDRCRKYAFVATIKNMEKEATQGFYMGIKNLIDEVIGGCGE